MGLSDTACMTQVDLILLERCRDNDAAAFQEIVQRYKGKLYNYLVRMTGNDEDAEDLTQEVFIRMYMSLDSFRSQSSLNTWLFRIAGNLCIDRFRRNKKRKGGTVSLDSSPHADQSENSAAAYDISDLSHEPYRLYEQREIANQIEIALGNIPEKLRSVVLLFDIEGLTYEEISKIIGCPLGTVKSRLFNGRVQLRKHLAEYLVN